MNRWADQKEWIEKFEDAVKNSICYTDVLKKMELNRNSGNFQTIQKYIKQFSLDISHFNSKKAMCRGLQKHSSESKKSDGDIFIENSNTSRSSIKKRYRNLVEYKCVICNNVGSHLNRPLILQLDHINGITNDNRLENLRWLCPNCHSQTETFAGKRKNSLWRTKISRKNNCKCGEEKDIVSKNCHKCNAISNRKVERPTKNQLERLILKKSWVEIGKQFNVSDNAVRKWAKNYKITLRTGRLKKE